MADPQWQQDLPKARVRYALWDDREIPALLAQGCSLFDHLSGALGHDAPGDDRGIGQRAVVQQCGPACQKRLREGELLLQRERLKRLKYLERYLLRARYQNVVEEERLLALAALPPLIVDLHVRPPAGAV